MTDRRRNAIRPGALLRPALLAAAIAAALAVRASVTLAVDHSPPPIAPIATNRDANVLFVDAREIGRAHV